MMPLLNAQLEFAIKQNIYLQLSLSQWALMQGDNSVYQTSFQSVSKSISKYFAFTNDVKPILEKLIALQKTNIQPALPSLDSTLVILSQADLTSSTDLEQPLKTPVILNKTKNIAPLKQSAAIGMEN